MSIVDRTWKPVVYAADCPDCPGCGEPWCELHKKHYHECDCIGPTHDGAEYRILNGVLHGRMTRKGAFRE